VTRRITTPTLYDETALDEHDVLVDPQTRRPIANWSKLATVVNRVDIKYDYNVPSLVPEDFAKRQIYSADSSLGRYAAQPSINEEFRGVRSFDTHTQDLLDRFALLFLQIWGYPPPILLLSVTFRRHLFEFLDSVSVTHAMIPHYEDGELGIDRERFVVLTVNPQLMDADGRPLGRIDLALLWLGHTETSAAPTSGGVVSFIPGESTVDATDVPVPLGGSATVTVPGSNSTQIRIGLKSNSHRTFLCYGSYYQELFSPPSCVYGGARVDYSVINTQNVYRVRYKRTTAPDQEGTGGDPSTGWVTLLSTTQGNLGVLIENGCAQAVYGEPPGSPPYPDVPPSVVNWTHFFDNLYDPPAGWNVRVNFDSVNVASGGCPINPATKAYGNCGGQIFGYGSCSDAEISSALCYDVKNLTLDFIEGIV
jgi:hypothetical protein